jgi:hypothetical protein
VSSSARKYTRSAVKHCECPDRHNPKIKCGYPLPCPHHTDKCVRKLRVLVVLDQQKRAKKRAGGRAVRRRR